MLYGSQNECMCPVLTTYIGTVLVNNTTARTPVADLARGKLTEHVVPKSEVSRHGTKITRHFKSETDPSDLGPECLATLTQHRKLLLPLSRAHTHGPTANTDGDRIC